MRTGATPRRCSRTTRRRQAAIPFKVNAQYPENQPLPSVPANLLLALPSLPAPLEYRIVGQHLLLLDTASDLIVDYMLNVGAT